MRTASEAVAYARRQTRNRVGYCLWHIQDAFAAPHAFPSASVQWANARKKHPGRSQSPRLAPRSCGRAARHGYGHIAVSVGNGRVRSTDAAGWGRWGEVPISYFEEHWGVHYAGWTEDIGGVAISGLGHAPAPGVYVHKLKSGVRDSDSVRALQKKLHGVPSTGFYGPQTEAAVKALKQKWYPHRKHVSGKFLGKRQARRLFGHGVRIYP